MTKLLALAAAASLLTATGAFAQAAMSAPPAGNAMMKSAAPKADATGMKADTDASAEAAKPKMHHRMAKNEAALNASEAETTKQLNMEQAQMSPGAK